MPPVLTIRKPEGALHGTVLLPRSKSVANRALLVAHMAGVPGCVTGLSDADDVRLLDEALIRRPAAVHCGLGGTTLRFLLAWAAVQEGEERSITGDAPLLARPHGDLVHALRTLGADVQDIDGGFLVQGRRLQGGSIRFHTPVSSQYISALMLVAPTMQEGLRIHWQGTQLSRPYVEMTARVLRHFGVQVRMDADAITVAPGPFVPAPLQVPCDWSAAAFWYEAVALAGAGSIHLPGLHADGWQGDEAVATLMAPWVRTEEDEAGITLHAHRHAGTAGTEVHFALRDTPDLFQALAFTMAGIGQAAHFTGLDNLAVKETDRMAAVCDTLAAMGVQVEQEASSVRMHGMLRCMDVAWPTLGDHRMAMAVAPLALACGSITLQDPQVVTKSHPGFWVALEGLGFRLEDAAAR